MVLQLQVSKVVVFECKLEINVRMKNSKNVRLYTIIEKIITKSKVLFTKRD